MPCVAWASRFKAALSVDKEKRDHPSTLRVNPRERLSPAGSRRSFASWIPKAVGGKVGLFIARSPAPCLPVSATGDPALVLALARMDDSIPEDQTARSHRPRAVEHRDWPSCGGDMGNISRVGRGGDERGSIPQLLSRLGVETVGRVGLRAGLDSTELPGVMLAENCA